MSATGALPGFRDFYPERFAERAWLFDKWREVAQRFGYAEYDGPPLEPLELYTKKSGDEIVGQLYNFTDKGGRDIALRPEMTPTVARMVGARANALRKPIRWFSVPQLFRYERQQKGRLREHFQLNVDIFGESDVSADAELLAVGCEIMRACGLGPDDVRARISDRRLLGAVLDGLGVPNAARPAAFAAIDKVGREPDDVLVKRMSDAGITASVGSEVLDVIRASSQVRLRERLAGDERVAAALDDLGRYLELLAAYGVGDYVEFDLAIVRGLAYYTGIVFELFDAKGEFRAICGGGRYDNLLEGLGYHAMPALGFGMGDVVLSELLRARGRMPSGSSRVDFWVAPVDGVGRPEVVEVATALRARGASVETPLRDQPLGKQLKAADGAGATRVVLVGPAFASSQAVEVKSLTDGNQRSMSLQELLSQLGEQNRGASDRP